MSQQEQNQPYQQHVVQDGQQPQYPGGGQPPVQGPPPGWTPPKPPKKPFFKRTGVIVTMAVIGLLIVIGIANGGGNGSGSTTAGDSPTVAPTSAPKASNPSAKAPATSQPKVTQSAPAVTACTGSRNDPCPVTYGKAFKVGRHVMGKGWKVGSGVLGTQLSGTVTNDSDETSTAFFTVKFLKGDEVVANFQCSTSELEPKQHEQVKCYNTTDVETPVKKGSYDKITAEADF
jgi:hypothetical protein